MLRVTVDEVEYDIRFWHYRWRSHAYRMGESSIGYTSCSIVVPENLPPVAIKFAYCSNKDNFCRAIGRKISLGRALIAAFPDKEDRRFIWEQYFKKLGVVHQ